MDGIVPDVRLSEKERIREQIKNCKNADLRMRYLIVSNLLAGRAVAVIVEVLGPSRSTVYKVAARFRQFGEAGLWDQRKNNGNRKVKQTDLDMLRKIVGGRPRDYGWRRSTWTRELLVETLVRITGVRIHPSTLSRFLKLLGCRLGRPKPIVGCPWPEARKNRRLREIRRLVDNLPDNEVAVYEDEVDVHLNPKIGRDWMNKGQQKEVMTPGKNQKRYLAGALDVRTGELLYVESDKKNTMLFIQMLWKLVTHYESAKVIHVILDNYCIHHAAEVEKSLATPAGQRIQLHFLPPYCPDHNKIERVWRDLHGNVTRNHQCDDMKSLMREVRYWLRKRNKQVLKTLAI